eukprot:5144930-Alexandrium_andersonii.AAC.1
MRKQVLARQNAREFAALSKSAQPRKQHLSLFVHAISRHLSRWAPDVHSLVCSFWFQHVARRKVEALGSTTEQIA